VFLNLSESRQSGNTEFVDKQLVVGALKRVRVVSAVQRAFCKSGYIMLLVSEVHPFNDGNGRIAPVMMNAELFAEGLSKLLFPLFIVTIIWER